VRTTLNQVWSNFVFADRETSPIALPLQDIECE
jgi:hypothetical protein